MKIKGVVATGHPKTSDVAEKILKEGGNAFDAIVAAFFMACVAEPVLASLGGGGFLLAKQSSASPFSLDFFVQTPLVKRPISELDFEEIAVDFGNATQNFHMGYGSIAVPGCVKGVFEIHQELCRMPIADLIAPSVKAAKRGMVITKEQAGILSLVDPIYVNRQSARELFVKSDDGSVLKENQIYQNTALSDVLEILAIEGQDFFYHGEIAKKIEHTAQVKGGSITANDLKNYRTHVRKPIEYNLNGADIYLNPPPSAGGLLVMFAMELFASLKPASLTYGSYEYYELLANTIELTQQARLEALSQSSHRELEKEILFEQKHLTDYQQKIATRHKANHGTTHISIADNQGNIAALTVSNGEGCGEILPQTGIMLNNMLGEDDLNPLGLNQWSVNRRLSSMMCPGIAIKDDQIVALGSGGSNRIRTAVLQVLINKMLFDLSLENSVQASRLHYDDELYLEMPDIKEQILNKLRIKHPKMRTFPRQDFYFGGVNAVSISPDNPEVIADSRRGGSAKIVS